MSVRFHVIVTILAAVAGSVATADKELRSEMYAASMRVPGLKHM